MATDMIMESWKLKGA